MKGTIKSFLPEKGYGFIRGEDGKDFHFHANSLQTGDIEHIFDGAFVEFEPAATPKGYRARSIKVSHDPVNTYNFPSEVVTSKSGTVRGWDVLDWADWTVRAGPFNSPDEAKNHLVWTVSNRLDCNAILNMDVVRGQNNSGNYIYSVFTAIGLPAIVGKKSVTGDLQLMPEMSVEEKMVRVKQHIGAEIRRKTMLRIKGLAASAGVFGIGYFFFPTNPLCLVLSVVGIVISFLATQVSDHGYWLSKNNGQKAW